VKRLARALARFVFGRKGLSRRLERSALAQGLARRLRAREWINGALARYPIQRRLESGVRYRVETFEALAVEREYFRNPVMGEIFRADPPATFVDLGCNCGIFPCFLADAAGGRAPRGLCVDANLAQVRLAERNMALNGWNEVQVRHGLVGDKNDAHETEFFLHPTSLGSSQFDYRDSESGLAPDWKRITVPTLRVEETWRQFFGETRCGCLKIDIEGSEMNFLRRESSFLGRVDAILLEWHIWGATREEVTEFLTGHGFAMKRVIEETPRHGVLFFGRS
jgi:FkbM family methyltransferase